MTKPPAGPGVEQPSMVEHADDGRGGVLGDAALVTQPDSRCLTRFEMQPEV